MRWWLTILALTTTIVASGAQPPLTIQWLSRPVGNQDSRFPSVTADGSIVVFQVGSGDKAQIWLAAFDPNTNQWRSDFVPIPNTNTPLLGLHPVISADGNHIAFASLQPYGGLNSTGNKQQVYVLDRTQNRIVPISVLWMDSDNDGIRDDPLVNPNAYLPSLGNCIPVYISANGRIVMFLAEWLPNASITALNIVDTNGDGIDDNQDADPTNDIPPPPNNAPEQWLLLIHDRDADGNGIFDEAGIGCTRTFIGSFDELNRLAPPAGLLVSANGRFIAFMTTYDNDNDGLIDEDPEGDINGDNDPDDDADGQIDEDPFDETWRVVVRDWQNGSVLSINNAFSPVLSDDGTYVAYLQPTNPTNETPAPPYLRAPMDLVVQRIDWTTTPPTLSQPLRLSGLQPSPQAGVVDGTASWGYSDWWSATTIAIDPQNPDVAYITFHSWASNLIDLTSAALDPQSKVNFYKGVPNIFVARFDFANNDVNLWHIVPAGPQWAKPKGLPVSLELTANNTFRLPLGASLMPTVSFVNGRQLFIVFQSLVPFDAQDANGRWDIYIATVPLP